MKKTITIYLLNIEKIKTNENKILTFLPKNRIEKANRYIKKEDYYLAVLKPSFENSNYLFTFAIA